MSYQNIAGANTSIICVPCSIKLERLDNMKKLLLGVATAAMMVAPAMSQTIIVPPVIIPPVIIPPAIPAAPVPVPVPVPVVPPPPPALGWVSARFVDCNDHCYISVRADGANVRDNPGGRVFLALVNDTPLVVYQRSGSWLLIAPLCNLRPVTWSDSHGVPLDACL
jgi:hypothetical protein